VRIPRGYIGKVVEVAWIDPTSSLHREDFSDVKRGRAGLATWREFGMVFDVTDGVLILAHSLGTAPGETTPDEGMLTRIVEDLITDLKVLAPEAPSTGGSGG
jgi:hypothetical protein